MTPYRAAAELRRYLYVLFMSILSPNAEEIEALASREELKEIQFSESPDRTALETLEVRILRHRPDRIVG